jgi:hypothetical protein
MKMKEGIRLFELVASIVTVIGASANSAMLTNTAPITENLYFQLLSGLRPTNQFLAGELIHYKIGSHEVGSYKTNKSFYRSFPVERSFDFMLFDQAGDEVKKTSLGCGYSASPREPKSKAQAAELHGHHLDSGRSEVYPLFRPDHVFALTKTGWYTLVIRVRCWAQTTNRGAPNELEGYFNPNLGTNLRFGVVMSPPVRVQIVKE